MPLYFLTLLLVTTATADTWNTFRGNPQLTGVATTDLAPPLTLLWTYSTQDAIESTAAIHEGTAYVGSLDGQLYALDLHTGALVWQYQADDEIKSSPTIADSTVYVGDEAGTFHAVAIQSGQRRWTFAADAGIIEAEVLVGRTIAEQRGLVTGVEHGRFGIRVVIAARLHQHHLDALPGQKVRGYAAARAGADDNDFVIARQCHRSFFPAAATGYDERIAATALRWNR